MKIKLNIGKIILTRTMYLLLALLLLLTKSTEERSGITRFLTCRSCPGTNSYCRDTCRGQYCYKAEFIADEYATVKRGCLNQTDGGIPVGGCEDTPSTLPGSDIQAIERMCICTKDWCNLSPSSSSTFITIGSVALFTACIL